MRIHTFAAMIAATLLATTALAQTAEQIQSRADAIAAKADMLAAKNGAGQGKGWAIEAEADALAERVNCPPGDDRDAGDAFMGEGDIMVDLGDGHYEIGESFEPPGNLLLTQANSEWSLENWESAAAIYDEATTEFSQGLAAFGDAYRCFTIGFPMSPLYPEGQLGAVELYFDAETAYHHGAIAGGGAGGGMFSLIDSVGIQDDPFALEAEPGSAPIAVEVAPDVVRHHHGHRWRTKCCRKRPRPLRRLLSRIRCRLR